MRERRRYPHRTATYAAPEPGPCGPHCRCERCDADDVNDRRQDARLDEQGRRDLRELGDW